MRVAIQVPVYDEDPRMLRDTLTAFKQANAESFEASYEAWITPSRPADPLFDVARECGFSTFEAPEGKLSARNAAHNSAFERGHDAFITIDADAPLLSDQAFEGMVRELREGAEGVNAVSIARRDPQGGRSVAGALVDAACLLEDVVVGHLSGRCSGVTREGWEHAGPFDDSIDQTDRTTVRSEEEFKLYRKVSEVGPVTYADDAHVHNDLRRHICKLPFTGSCDRFDSDVTFSPKDVR